MPRVGLEQPLPVQRYFSSFASLQQWARNLDGSLGRNFPINSPGVFVVDSIGFVEDTHVLPINRRPATADLIKKKDPRKPKNPRTGQAPIQPLKSRHYRIFGGS